MFRYQGVNNVFEWICLKLNFLRWGILAWTKNQTESSETMQMYFVKCTQRQSLQRKYPYEVY